MKKELIEQESLSDPAEPVSEKEEILREIREIKTKQNKKRLHWSSVLITTILILLIVFSGIQAVQSANILIKVRGNDFKSSSSGSASQGTSQTPSSAQDLPNMVGGC